MLGPKKPNSVVGLDIEAGSVAAVELRHNGSAEVSRVAIEALEPDVVTEGEVRDPEALGGALKGVFSRHKLSRTVRVGIANQRVVVRTLHLPLIEDPEEVDAAVRFQAQDQIPMPLEQAVLDHEVVARRSDPEGDRGMDVIAVAARRDMVGALVEALREGGLQPAGIDLSAFGMIRALQPAGPEAAPGAAPEPAALFCHLGDLTNIAVARAGVCLMTRVAPYGIDDIAARVAERRAMPLEDASDWLVEVGLEEPLDSFDADREQAAAAREALEEGAAKLVDELRVSLDFFASQEGAPPVERVIVCGWGTTIPGLAERIQAGLGVPIEAMSPRALSGLGDEDAARLTVSYGLALGG